MKPPPRDCPLCGQESECVDWAEVDIGVGTMVGNQEYLCPTHGEWCLTELGQFKYRKLGVLP